MTVGLIACTVLVLLLLVYLVYALWHAEEF
ncbi:K(+)-transporting ATPase subunit F [Edwardsiella tarda]|nr:K(+)-transporting ATPase subunit F [Edwardsiella tarda]WKS81989.1 K(+)-transporting ATPase subunit F [Edwardsiella tarda]